MTKKHTTGKPGSEEPGSEEPGTGEAPATPTPSKLYAAAVADIAGGVKTLCAAGLGGESAGAIASDIWYRLNVPSAG